MSSRSSTRFSEGIVTRMQKLVFLVERARLHGLEGLGLAGGEWELLHSLRRQGAPWRATYERARRERPPALSERADQPRRPA